MRRLVMAAVVASTALACGGTPTRTSRPERLVHALPPGKSVMTLAAQTYAAPPGFRPQLRVAVDEGWLSTHRSSDAFDLSRPDPQRDAPAVAVVVLHPAGRDSRAVARRCVAEARRAGAQVATQEGRLSGAAATTVDVRGGDGEVIAGREGGIALDATPRGRLRITLADFAGGVLAVVVYVPRGQDWRRWWPVARGLVEHVAVLA